MEIIGVKKNDAGVTKRYAKFKMDVPACAGFAPLHRDNEPVRVERGACQRL
jgi:hypothetical protein